MAAQPIRRAQEKHLNEHEIEVFEARAGGASWREVAAMFLTSTHVLNLWLKAPLFPDRWPAWKSLDEVAAESRASDAKEILDTAYNEARMGISSPEIARLAISRAELAKWEAGVMARGRFGTAQQTAGVTVNINQLHLTAVKAPPPPPPPELIAIEGLDYEVVAECTMEELLHG